MATTARSRATALRAAYGGCPRCAAGRRPSQRYCLECGLALPPVAGRLAGARRAWITHLGWYPGDFVWSALGLVGVAALGGTAALLLGQWRAPSHPGTVVAPLALIPPAAVAIAPARNGATRWPPGRSGWTVVLASLPVSAGTHVPEVLAERAAAAGLPQVGVLDSATFASLLPGYEIVFSGIYGGAADARSALASVQARGYDGAYTSPITP